MSVSHHGDSEIMKRFIDQVDGTARREYPAGRMGHEDDGALAMAITIDRQRNTIVIRFGKPVEWIGFGRKEAEALIGLLQTKLNELAAGV